MADRPLQPDAGTEPPPGSEADPARPPGRLRLVTPWGTARPAGAGAAAPPDRESPEIPEDRRIEALLRPMSSQMAEPNPYLRTKILTASPVELRLLLFDGAIRFLRSGLDGLAEQDYERMYEGVSRTQNIVLELLNALDPEQAPDLCSKLSGLYTFMYLELVEGHTTRDEGRLREVLRLLEFERETWVMLMDKLAREGGDPTRAATPAPPPAGAAPATTGSPEGGTLSLRG